MFMQYFLRIQIDEKDKSYNIYPFVEFFLFAKQNANKKKVGKWEEREKKNIQRLESKMEIFGIEFYENHD